MLIMMILLVNLPPIYIHPHTSLFSNTADQASPSKFSSSSTSFLLPRGGGGGGESDHRLLSFLSRVAPVSHTSIPTSLLPNNTADRPTSTSPSKFFSSSSLLPREGGGGGDSDHRLLSFLSRVAPVCETLMEENLASVRRKRSGNVKAEVGR